MRLAVTGSTGFVGQNVVCHFAAQGHTIHAFGRRVENPFPDLPAVHYHIWDIATGPYLDPPAVDAVIHCAGAVATWGRYAGFYRTNVDGMRHLLATFPAPVHVIFVSSASVYDAFRNQDGITEGMADPPRYVTRTARRSGLRSRCCSPAGGPRSSSGPAQSTVSAIRRSCRASCGRTGSGGRSSSEIGKPDFRHRAGKPACSRYHWSITARQWSLTSQMMWRRHSMNC